MRATFKQKRVLKLLILTILMTVLMMPFGTYALAENDLDLRIITDPKFDYILPDTDSLIYTKVDNIVRFTNRDGTVIIDDVVSKFLGDNIDNNLVYISTFKEGVAYVALSKDRSDRYYHIYEKQIFFDAKGNIVLDVFSSDFLKNSLAAGIAINGFELPNEGKSIINTHYPDDGLLWYDFKTKKIVKPTIYGLDNHIITTFEYQFNEGLLAIAYKENEDDSYQYLYIDKNAEVKTIVPSNPSIVYGFNNGLALIKVEEKVGFIDKYGNIAIPLDYDDVYFLNYSTGQIFSDGIACIKKGNYWGFINAKGEVIHDFNIKLPDEQWAGFVRERGILLNEDGKYYMVNTKGKQVGNSLFDDLNHLTKYGVTLASNDEAYFFVNENAKRVSNKSFNLEMTAYNNTMPDFIRYYKDDQVGLAIITKATDNHKPSTWASKDVNRAIKMGIVPAHLQDNYQGTISRVRFCELAVHMYEKATGKPIQARKEFKDTINVNIEKMAGMGFINGTNEGTFNPNGTITRERAAIILVKMYESIKGDITKTKLDFTDRNSISVWAKSSVAKARALNLISSMKNNRFNPQNLYTIEQSIIDISRLFEKIK